MLTGKRIFLRSLLLSYLVLSAVVTLVVIRTPALAASPDVSIGGPITGSAAVPKPATAYELVPSSNFYQGCFGPCMCPVQITGELTGTFDLTPLKPNKLFTRYGVTDISWSVSDSQGMVVHKITGNGIYEISKGASLTQQMTLFLSIDGQQPVTFDSGLVPEQTKFPDISVSIFNGTCFGFWMTINAVPK